MKKKLLVIHSRDNVGVLLQKAEAGDICTHEKKTIKILKNTEFAHKIALTDIPAEATVFKYGEEIGYALTDIKKGEWVHNHNMGCRRGK
ncbi:MAG: UxaA family hydrolase [Desulfobacterales bacterium]|nr:UxaA family hydrolase [Desulfobacterales bacterium]